LGWRRSQGRAATRHRRTNTARAPAFPLNAARRRRGGASGQAARDGEAGHAQLRRRRARWKRSTRYW
jgi:hypothetical protein